MKELSPNSRSLIQHRIQARRLQRRAIFEAMAVVVLSFGMYILIRDGLHIALKIICGVLILTSAANGLGDYLGYKKRLETILQMEKRD
jgi:hypothetical protein